MPSVQGKRVVIFGDSLSADPGSPGYELGAMLARNGASVKINARIGRSANNFYGREDVAGQMADITAFQPDLAIVELGTNDLGLNMTVDEQQMIRVRDALIAAGAKQVYAFGPPSFADGTATTQAVDVLNMMRNVFGAKLLDLRPLTRDILTTAQGRTGDGVHFTSSAGKVVGDRMATAFLATNSMSGVQIAAAFVLGIGAWWALR